MNRLPLVVHTLYAELADLCRAEPPAPWPLSGSLVRVPVKEQEHWYYQKSRRTSPGPHQQREYLGPVTDADLAARVAAFEDAKAAFQERVRLVAALKAAGAPAPTGRLAGLLLGLAEAGLLERAVLVGTAAFQAFGPMLGARFGPSSFQTLDLDLCAAAGTGLALRPWPGQPPLLGLLQGIDATFREVPGLRPGAPAVAYMNQARLRVDVLLPLTGRAGGGRPAPGLGSHGQPQRFLDFLVQDPVQAVLLTGGGVLAHVPQPARFGLHKLLVSRQRPAIEQAKARKDLAQAGQLLALLLDQDPESVETACQDLAARGAGWKKHALNALQRLEGTETAERVAGMLRAV
jgi:hypothetical protein